MLFTGTTLLKESTPPDKIMLVVVYSTPSAEVRVTEEIVGVTATKFAALLKGTVIVIVV